MASLPERPGAPPSPPEYELGDDRAVPLDVLASQVLQQPASATDQHQETTAAVMVLLVHLEVLREVADPLGQDRDLDLGGARVTRRACVLLDDLGLGFFREGHG